MQHPAGSQAADARSGNSYDFVRFCAACSVLFSHHFDLAGLSEPVVPGYGEDFGQLGVQIFFCLSGFLICQSLQKSNDWARFVAARFLRIYPNLAFALVAASASTLVWYGNYSNLSAHANYVGANLLMFVKGVTHVIPGIFTDTVRASVNEPLWTLPYELWMYALLFLMFLPKEKIAATCVVAGAIVFSILWGMPSLRADRDIGPLESFELVRLGSYFLSGATIAVFWSLIARRALAVGAAGLAGIFIVRGVFPFDSVLHSLALAACIAGLGSSRAMAWFAKGGDASYGIYVFAWPIQQFCLLLVGNFWVSMLAAFAITTALGYATWHGFERRAMSRRNWLAEKLRHFAQRVAQGPVSSPN